MLPIAIKSRGRGEGEADPEAARHVAEFGIFLVLCRDRARLESHAADRTTSGPGAHDFRVHGAGVFRLRLRKNRFRFQDHTAFRARPGSDLTDFRAHGANVIAFIFLVLPYVA